MMKRVYLLIIALLLTVPPINGFASEKELPKQEEWPFDGVFGRFDKQAIQRGFQVYKDVCAVCHSMQLLHYRNLEEVGFSKEEVTSLAASYQVSDGPNDKGEMFLRPARASDKFVSPYQNEQAARYTNNGAYPPDLSLIIKARGDGANYVHSLLVGFGHALPAGLTLGDGMYYNPYFPGKQIAMPPPLVDGMVTYQDGTVASVEQMSSDVVNFLQWAAEPEMEKRKAMGLKVAVYLFLLTIVFYIAKSRVWAKVDRRMK